MTNTIRIPLQPTAAYHVLAALRLAIIDPPQYRFVLEPILAAQDPPIDLGRVTRATVGDDAVLECDVSEVVA